MAEIDRFVAEAGETVTQDVNSIISDVKNQFSKGEMKNLVRQSITKGIANCQLDRDKKTEDVNKPGNAVDSITKSVTNITKTIEGTLDCTRLQQEVKTQLDSFKGLIDDGTEFIQKKLEEILGIVKVPLNPFKLPKYIVKQTIGRVLPDLEATIDFIKSTVALVNALSKLIDTVSKIEERLESCALDTIKLVTTFARNEIDEAINELKMTVSDAIADAICNSLQKSGIKANDIDDVFSAINSIKQLKNTITDLQTTAKAALGNSVSSIGSKQADIQTLTGIAPVLDTTSLDAFIVSVDSPEYAQYITDVAAVVNLPEPVNTELPVITGTAAVGETLVSSNGVWTANGVVSNQYTLAFQWMRQGQEIFGANTYQYVPVIDDVDYPVYCRVRAENQVNIEEVFTANTSPVVFSMSASNKPVVSGTPTAGQTLTCSEGTWPFTTTAFTYEWSRVVVPGSNVRVQSSSSNNTYYVKTADIGSSIKCKVVAQAFRYTLSVDSANTAVIS
jgi:hypothetical protein